MKRLRLISILLLTLVLSFSFIACSAKEEAAPVVEKTTEVKTAVVEKAPEPVVDPVVEAANAFFANKPDDSYLIKETAFVDMVKAGEEPFILDIRSAADYEAGHVMGAFNAPWGATAIPAALSQLPVDQTVYVYCVSGQTAGQTVALLNVAGFDAKSVRYGYKLGISKVEGVEEVIETTPNFLEDLGTEIDPAIEAAIVDYYATLNADESTKSNIIAASAAKDNLDASEGEIVVVSIRKASDFEDKHIEGAINIPYGKGMQENFSQLPKDKQLYVYCYSGQTAGQTVAILKLLGYDAASVKSGFGTGMSGGGWNNEGLPIIQTNVVEEAANAYFAEKAADNNIIKEDAFLAKIEDGEELFILDIRKASDYEAGHIIGAYSAPWGPTAIPAVLENLPTDQTVYVYCVSGQTAGQTVALLNVAGIEAKSVRYGFKLGISKVEGYEDFVVTEPYEMEELGNTIDPQIEAAIVDYYATLNEDERTKSNIISAEAAKDLLDASEGEIVLVSIRQPADYAAGHIEGAINIPWAQGMQTSFEQLPKDQQILLYCYSGQTAGQTVAIMKLLGYDVASIKSGFGTGMSGGGWNNEGFPVVQ